MTSESGSDGPVEAPKGPRLSPRTSILLASILGAVVVWLRFEGRVWWCKSGGLAPWSGGINSEHTSQHFFDPYSFSHLLHGLLFYGLFKLVAGRLRWDARLVLAIALECLWEVFENSEFVINRYRQATVSLGYEGDSILNSLGDIASCAVGFLIASRLPVKWSIALYLGVELALLILYRDNLFLNVIMLIHPFEAIKSWQMGH